MNHLLHITSVTTITRALGFVKAPWLGVMRRDNRGSMWGCARGWRGEHNESRCVPTQRPMARLKHGSCCLNERQVAERGGLEGQEQRHMTGANIGREAVQVFIIPEVFTSVGHHGSVTDGILMRSLVCEPARV